jgi:hypothetical protein
MDMETVKPRTCQMCLGTGTVSWYIDDDTFETRECECKLEGDINA